MPFFNFFCDEDHDETAAEVRCEWSSLLERTPKCPTCGRPMKRDYQAEAFGGCSNPSKGIYPMDDDGISPTMEIVRINDRQHHERLLKQYGLVRKDRMKDLAYNRKHVRDRITKDERR